MPARRRVVKDIVAMRRAEPVLCERFQYGRFTCLKPATKLHVEGAKGHGFRRRVKYCDDCAPPDAVPLPPRTEETA